MYSKAQLKISLCEPSPQSDRYFAIALTTLLFTSLFTIIMSINSSYENYTFRQVGGYCHGTFKEVTENRFKDCRPFKYKGNRQAHQYRLYRQRCICQSTCRSQLYGCQLHQMELCQTYHRTHASERQRNRHGHKCLETSGY